MRWKAWDGVWQLSSDWAILSRGYLHFFQVIFRDHSHGTQVSWHCIHIQSRSPSQTSLPSIFQSCLSASLTIQPNHCPQLMSWCRFLSPTLIPGKMNNKWMVCSYHFYNFLSELFRTLSEWGWCNATVDSQAVQDHKLYRLEFSVLQ